MVPANYQSQNQSNPLKTDKIAKSHTFGGSGSSLIVILNPNLLNWQSPIIFFRGGGVLDCDPESKTAEMTKSGGKAL